MRTGESSSHWNCPVDIKILAATKYYFTIKSSNTKDIANLGLTIVLMLGSYCSIKREHSNTYIAFQGVSQSDMHTGLPFLFNENHFH